MHKKSLIIMTLVVGIACFIAQPAFSFQLLSKEDALKEIFGKNAEIVTESRELSGEVLENIKKRLGGSLVDHQDGSESADVAENTKVDFHFAVKDGEKYGVAIIDVEPGKWGPVEFIVALDMKGIVRTVKVLSYQEKRGRPIARRGFMSQYKGKTSSDPLEVGKDITGISGATISSRSATFAVKKAIVLTEEIILKK